MNLSKAIVLTIIMSIGALMTSASPDHKNHVKKDSAQVNKNDWVDQLKKSVQFNYGVPLPKDILTAKKIKSVESTDDGFYNWIQKKYAKKMEVHPSLVTNKSLYKFINDWYGTRYVYGGTTRRGIDCSSFVQKCIKATFDVGMVRTAANQKRTTEYVKREDLQEGDLVFFRIKVNRISHVGVYLQNGRFAHASSSRGVMISNLNSSYWSRYYAGGGRVK